MTLTFPLPVADFADLIGVTQVKWWLQDNREFSGMGSGQILQADLAPQLWMGDVTLREYYHADARRIEAKINSVIRAIGSVYLYDPRVVGPYADPKGVVLGSSAVKINSLPDAKSMSLKGLPGGYDLTEGDYFCFDYGTPARRAFHEVTEAATASGSGATGAFEVNPVIRPGASVNAAVTLIRPAMKCLIKPGTMDVSTTGHTVTTVISFSVVQKL